MLQEREGGFDQNFCIQYSCLIEIKVYGCLSTLMSFYLQKPKYNYTIRVNVLKKKKLNISFIFNLSLSARGS